MKEKGFKANNGGNERALVLFIFILGIVIGALVSVYMVFPEMNKTVLETAQETGEKNNLLEQEIDSYVSCLNANEINPQNC